MDRVDFVDQLMKGKLNKKEFNVFNKDKKQIGAVGVMRKTIVFLDMPIIPEDFSTGEYKFVEIKEK